MMNWKHPRNMTKSERKQRETDAGTRWWVIAGLTTGV